MKRIITAALLSLVVSCSPIAPSTSKLVSQNVTQDKLQQPSKDIFQASLSKNSKILNPIFISQSDYRKKSNSFFKEARLISLAVSKDQNTSFSKDGKFKLTLEHALKNINSESMRVIFIIQDSVSISDLINTDEVVLSLKTNSEDETNENEYVLESSKLEATLIAPSLDAKDPIIGARADKLLHYTDKIIFQYQFNSKE